MDTSETKYDLASLAGKKIVITGGAGMIGSTLAIAAVRHGAHVTIIDALLPLYGGNMFNLSPILEDVVFIKGDIREVDLIPAVKDSDIVFHLAAQVSYVDSNKDPFLDLDINCKGTLALLNACLKGCPSAKVVLASSRFVYGRIEYNPVDERHPLNCLSIYGIHKLAAERYLRFFHDAYGLNTTSLRISNPYGPRQQMKHGKYGVLNWFVRLGLDRDELTIYGDGKQKRDYVYVQDITEAMCAVALVPRTAGEIYNLGSGIGTQFVDMAQCIADHLPNSRICHKEWPWDAYFVETGDYVSNVSKLQRATGWSARKSLREGIEATIEFYQQNRQHYW